MTWLLSELKRFWQSALSVLDDVLASWGICLRTLDTHWPKLGGSLGTMTGWPGFCAAWLLAATNIQWSKAWRVTGLPATLATASPGTPLPHAATLMTSTKKAPSAVMYRFAFIDGG